VYIKLLLVVLYCARLDLCKLKCVRCSLQRCGVFAQRF